MKYPYMKNADLKLINLCKKGINSLYKVEYRNYALAYDIEEDAVAHVQLRMLLDKEKV